MSIDETTDSVERYVANVITETLNTGAPEKTDVLTIKVLEKTNYSMTEKMFDYPIGIRHDNILLFVTNTAPCMVKTGRTLQSLYSKIIHLTYLAHGIHRIPENTSIRGKFKKVVKLISRVKHMFLKALRVLAFKSKTPIIPLRPEPILTR